MRWCGVRFLYFYLKRCILQTLYMGKERIMSKMFKTHQNTIGNLAITLLFVGGCIFLLTGSWDAAESETAKGCCGGDTTATTLTAVSTGGCCGGANKLTDSGCSCVSGANCSTDVCATSTSCGNNSTTDVCVNSCSGKKNKCKSDGCCDGKICSKATKCSNCEHD